MNNIIRETLKNIHFSAQGIVFAIVLSLAFFLLGMGKLKTYQSEMTILVVSKSANAINQQTQILDNIMQLPKTLSFYDRLLKDNPSLEDSAAGEDPANRKKSWNNMISIMQISKNGSMISITLSINSPVDSEIIATKTVRTLLDVTSSYYNIKDDLDLRIVDGPITRLIIPGWQWLLVASIFLGSLVSMAFGKIITLQDKPSRLQNILENNPLRNFRFVKKDKQSMPIEALESLYKEDARQDAATEVVAQDINKTEDLATQTSAKNKVEFPEEEVKNIQEIANRNIYPNFPEMPVHGVSKSSAPDNLPIADFGAEFDQKNKEEVKDMPGEHEAKEITHEPTADQLKERLNQLLRGEM
ncbi:MAG: hypothetical protein WCF93_05135 [Candidatus Moraniibacteriota bacterium]